MGSVNKVIIVGNLGSDPEVRYLDSGNAVASFSVATSESWVDKGGEKTEKTEWHRIVVWGKLAELCGEYLTKGRQVYVEGRIESRKWHDNDGAERISFEIKAREVTFLSDSKSKSSHGQDSRGASGRANARANGRANGRAVADEVPF